MINPTLQYRYVFVADDIFANRFYSDTASPEMLCTYDELTENPPPDGEYAARITKIIGIHRIDPFSKR